MTLEVKHGTPNSLQRNPAVTMPTLAVQISGELPPRVSLTAQHGTVAGQTPVDGKWLGHLVQIPNDVCLIPSSTLTIKTASAAHQFTLSGSGEELAATRILLVDPNAHIAAPVVGFKLDSDRLATQGKLVRAALESPTLSISLPASLPSANIPEVGPLLTGLQRAIKGQLPVSASALVADLVGLLKRASESSPHGDILQPIVTQLGSLVLTLEARDQWQALATSDVAQKGLAITQRFKECSAVADALARACDGSLTYALRIIAPAQK